MIAIETECPACGGPQLRSGTREGCTYCNHTRDLTPDERRRYLQDERRAKAAIKRRSL